MSSDTTPTITSESKTQPPQKGPFDDTRDDSFQVHYHKKMSGKEFNEIVAKRAPYLRFYKLTVKSGIHRDVTYHEGLIQNPDIFYTSSECSSGGLYFCDQYEFQVWTHYEMGAMYYFYDVQIPDDAQVYIENIHKFKCDQFILSNKRLLTEWEGWKHPNQHAFAKTQHPKNLVFFNLHTDFTMFDLFDVIFEPTLFFDLFCDNDVIEFLDQDDQQFANIVRSLHVRNDYSLMLVKQENPDLTLCIQTFHVYYQKSITAAGLLSILLRFFQKSVSDYGFSARTLFNLQLYACHLSPELFLLLPYSTFQEQFLSDTKLFTAFVTKSIGKKQQHIIDFINRWIHVLKDEQSPLLFSNEQIVMILTKLGTGPLRRTIDLMVIKHLDETNHLNWSILRELLREKKGLSLLTTRDMFTKYIAGNVERECEWLSLPNYTGYELMDHFTTIQEQLLDRIHIKNSPNVKVYDRIHIISDVPNMTGYIKMSQLHLFNLNSQDSIEAFLLKYPLFVRNLDIRNEMDKYKAFLSPDSLLVFITRLSQSFHDIGQVSMVDEYIGRFFRSAHGWAFHNSEMDVGQWCAKVMDIDKGAYARSFAKAPAFIPHILHVLGGWSHEKRHWLYTNCEMLVSNLLNTPFALDFIQQHPDIIFSKYCSVKYYAYALTINPKLILHLSAEYQNQHKHACVFYQPELLEDLVGCKGVELDQQLLSMAIRNGSSYTPSENVLNAFTQAAKKQTMKRKRFIQRPYNTEEKRYYSDDESDEEDGESKRKKIEDEKQLVDDDDDDDVVDDNDDDDDVIFDPEPDSDSDN